MKDFNKLSAYSKLVYINEQWIVIEINNDHAIIQKYNSPEKGILYKNNFETSKNWFVLRY